MAWLEDFTWVNKVTTLGPTNLNKINRAIRNMLNAFPGGGLTGQVLTKNSNADFDTAWATPIPGGGGGGGIGFGSNVGSNLSIETTATGGISLESDVSDISLFAAVDSCDVTGTNGVNVQGRGNGGVSITTTGIGDLVLAPGNGIGGSSDLNIQLAGNKLLISGLSSTDPGTGVWSDNGTLRMSGASKQPGAQWDFAQITADTAAITATTEGTATQVILGNSVTYDGTKVKIEFWAPGQVNSSGAIIIKAVILRDSTVIGQATLNDGMTIQSGMPSVVCFDTPAAGAHTYKASVFVSGGNVVIKAGAGGSGNLVPAFLRVTKV